MGGLNSARLIHPSIVMTPVEEKTDQEVFNWRGLMNTMGVAMGKVTHVKPPMELKGATLRLDVKTASISDRNFRYEDASIKRWHSKTTRVLWDVSFVSGGELDIAIGLANNKMNAGASIRAQVGAEEVVGKTVHSGGWTNVVTMPIGSLRVHEPGTLTVSVQIQKLTGLCAGNFVYVILSGSASEEAEEVYISPRAGYIGFVWNKTDKCSLFYNCVKVTDSFPGTQFTICGIDHMDLMLIENDCGVGRYVLFSCLSQYANDPEEPAEVPKYGHPVVVFKGAGVSKQVFTSDVGGAFYTLAYSWKVGVTYHFMLRFETPEDNRLKVSGYFYMNDKKQWLKIASYLMDCDKPEIICGMHSSIRDFYRRHGRFQREAIFGPAWKKVADDPWKQVTSVTFFQDGNEANVNAGVTDGERKLFLAAGGKIEQAKQLYKFEVNATDSLPHVLHSVPD